MRIRFLLISGFLILTSNLGNAGSATWNASPISEEWNTKANWTPPTVPNGPNDIATFSLTTESAVSLTASTEVDSIAFDAMASAYAIAPGPGIILTISGTGIMNNSTTVQGFIPANNQAGDFGVISFTNNATAGAKTRFTNNGGIVELAYGGEIDFADNATAGRATFVNGGATVPEGLNAFITFSGNSSAGNASFTSNGGAAYLALGGEIHFHDNATAGQATFVTNGGVASQSIGAFTEFYDDSSAGDATLITNGGTFPGETLFVDTSTAGNAILIANGGPSDDVGGSIRIYDSSTGGTARVMVFGKGELNLISRNIPEVVIGSIEGDGVVTGAYPLIVGSNNLSTTFSGVIKSGAVVKTGRGQLVLTGANTHTGGTRVMHGALMVDNSSGSATGIGPVQVNGGILGGTGTIAGPVTIGTGIGTGAVLAPSAGLSQPAILTLQQSLTFKADATYSYKLNTSNATADQVIANQVIIESGAQFSFQSFGNRSLPIGTIFTAISNTWAQPTSGTGIFANLPDGSTFTVGRNNFRVSYEGGDGNDLTLTVVP
jgi:autotransporter-associated beta strand protein